MSNDKRITPIKLKRNTWNFRCLPAVCWRLTAFALAVCTSIAQTSTSMNRGPTLVLSKQFVEAAMSANTSLDGLKDHIERGEFFTYELDAKTSMANANIRVNSRGDEKCYKLLLEYHLDILGLRIAWLHDQAEQQRTETYRKSDYSLQRAALESFARCMQNQLDKRRYDASCSSYTTPSP